MWGLISGVSNAYFGVVDMYNDVVTFLYWDVFDNLCDKLEAIANGLFVRFIALVLLLITAFILSAHFGLFDEESKYQSSRGAHCEQHIKDVTKKRRSKEPRTPVVHAIVPTTPVTPTPPPPPPRCSEMVLQSLTPSPFKLPFKHFRGTGASFGPLRRIEAPQYPRYTRPHLHKDTTSLSVAQKLDKLQEETLVGRDTKRTVKFDIDVPKKQMSASKPPLQLRPVTPPPKVEAIQVLPQVPVSKPLEAPPPSPLPDLETVRKDALKRIALEEYRIRQEMVHFLTVITTGVGHESSATIILDMMNQAKQYLEQYFPDGLGHLPFNQIIWRASILTFWDVLSPYGWDFLHHPDQRLPEFLRRFRYLAVWFGLGSRLREFECVEPPAPEPALPEPVPAPVEVIPSIPENLVAGLSLSEPAVLDLPAYQPAVQELPAPEPAVLHTAPAPIEAQPQEPPKLAQISFAHTLPPTTFAFTMGSNSNFSPTTPSTRRKPKPTTSRKQPAKPSPTDPNLLSFTDPSWIHLPTHKLNTLTWSSFSWASPLQARLKIWGHSTLTHLSLPRNNPKPITSSYLKSHLESVALEFKRAAVILRLQAQGGCEKPCEEDLGMTPLFGEVVMLVEFAADMTAACEEMVVWDEQDEWFRACVYFRDNVREEEAVWKALCEAYGREKYTALERAWEEGSKEWLLLDEEY